MDKQENRDEEILKMREAGMSKKEVGEKYGISGARVTQICNEQIRIRKGKDCVIKCGNREMFLTKIEKQKDYPPVYYYKSNDIKKALRFTMEEAQEIAKKCRGIVCMVMEGR